jgi:NADH pyrophosphatase NudC (nudix superfamily)
VDEFIRHLMESGKESLKARGEQTHFCTRCGLPVKAKDLCGVHLCSKNSHPDFPLCPPCGELVMNAVTRLVFGERPVPDRPPQ